MTLKMFSEMLLETNDKNVTLLFGSVMIMIIFACTVNILCFWNPKLDKKYKLLTIKRGAYYLMVVVLFFGCLGNSAIVLSDILGAPSKNSISMNVECFIVEFFIFLIYLATLETVWMEVGLMVKKEGKDVSNERQSRKNH